ncbi:MAG: type II toxin-antitoxin system HigB family toxin [Imperialibacter sp.]|uniref:type II toxin-antitoxin system HigB family toxin n=1 Tax=Imperialibacter sp. TaxID=2038411 RepID=UPI0032EAD91F
MNIINRQTLKNYCLIHAEACEGLETWYKVAKKAEWSNFNEVRAVYPSADQVGDNRMVFNIKGNKFRLIVRFSFIYKVILVKWFGTHAEYDKIDVTKV